MIGEAVQAAERYVLGVCLRWPERIAEVSLEPQHFAVPQWRAAFGAVQALSSDGDAVDPVTVAEHLERQGRQDVTPTDLAGLVLEPATADNVGHYADVVREAWVTRQVALACGEVLEARKEGTAGADLLSVALEKLAGIDAEQPPEGEAIGALVKQRMRDLEELFHARQRGDAALTGIPTGIEAIDGMLGGLQPGIVTVVAGRPGMGKSAFGMTVADANSLAGRGVHVFSLEDTRDSYTDRALSRGSNVPAERLRSLEWQRRDMQPLLVATEELAGRGGWIVDDRSGITADEIVRSVRRAKRDNGTQVVLVDYVQLVRGRPGIDRRERIDDAMDTFANAAKRDRMAYLVFSQLNRACEYRDNKRPILADLKESGGIEEKAKCVMFLYRAAKYEPNAPEDEIEILVRKNNNGSTGTVIASWDGPTTRIW